MPPATVKLTYSSLRMQNPNKRIKTEAGSCSDPTLVSGECEAHVNELVTKSRIIVELQEKNNVLEEDVETTNKKNIKLKECLDKKDSMITKLKKNSASMGDNFKIAVANKAEAQELRIKVTDLTLTLVEKEELIKVLQENLQRTEMEKESKTFQIKKLNLLIQSKKKYFDIKDQEIEKMKKEYDIKFENSEAKNLKLISEIENLKKLRINLEIASTDRSESLQAEKQKLAEELEAYKKQDLIQTEKFAELQSKNKRLIADQTENLKVHRKSTELANKTNQSLEKEKQNLEEELEVCKGNSSALGDKLAELHKELNVKQRHLDKSQELKERTLELKSQVERLQKMSEKNKCEMIKRKKSEEDLMISNRRLETSLQLKDDTIEKMKIRLNDLKMKDKTIEEMKMKVNEINSKDETIEKLKIKVKDIKQKDETIEKLKSKVIDLQCEIKNVSSDEVRKVNELNTELHREVKRKEAIVNKSDEKYREVREKLENMESELGEGKEKENTFMNLNKDLTQTLKIKDSQIKHQQIDIQSKVKDLEEKEEKIKYLETKHTAVLADNDRLSKQKLEFENLYEETLKLKEANDVTIKLISDETKKEKVDIAMPWPCQYCKVRFEHQDLLLKHEAAHKVAANLSNASVDLTRDAETKQEPVAAETAVTKFSSGHGEQTWREYKENQASDGRTWSPGNTGNNWSSGNLGISGNSWSSGNYGRNQRREFNRPFQQQNINRQFFNNRPGHTFPNHQNLDQNHQNFDFNPFNTMFRRRHF